MTVTFPRVMPEGIGEVEFELARLVRHAPERGGRVVSVMLGQPAWVGRFRTVPLWGARQGEWRAFLASLKNGARTFLAGDPERPYPFAYLAGFGGLTRAGGADPFDGAPLTWSLNAERDVLSLTGLPAAFAVTVGDYAGLSWSDGARRFLVRALENATGDSGGEVSFQVEPFLPPFVPDEVL